MARTANRPKKKRGAALRIRAQRRTAADRTLSKDRVIWIGPKVAGVWVTPDEALRLSAVWACVSVISKALASCRVDVFREDERGNRESLPLNFGIWRLLNLRPNPETTAFAFREAAYIQALIYGNFYAEIERDMMGRPVALWPLAAERCCLERDDATQQLVLRVQNMDRAETVLPYDDVFHLHGPGVDGLCGFDTVSMAARSLAHLAAVERFGLAFYGNGTSMGGVLHTEQKLSPERVKEIREAVNAQHQGPDKAFKFLLLDGGLQWQSTSVEPDKAQYVEGKVQLILEVCRWFGVPPHKIAELSRSTFSNIEHQGLEFVRDALTPWAERFAQEADWKLILANNVGTRIELEWLAEGDAKSKADTDSVLVQNGLLSRNEARKRRGLNNLGPDGDKLTVQSNLTLLEKVGENLPGQGDAGGPPADSPPDGEDTPPAERAARDIFAGTMRRVYQRLGERTKAAVAAGDADAAALAREHAHFMGSQIGDAIAVLERAGVRFDDGAVRTRLNEFVDMDAGTLGSAVQQRIALDGDNYIREKAHDRACRLAELIRKG